MLTVRTSENTVRARARIHFCGKDVEKEMMKCSELDLST